MNNLIDSSQIVKLYRSIGEIYCPYFKEKIIFNAKGLEHLKFKMQKSRSTQEVLTNITVKKLLHLA